MQSSPPCVSDLFWHHLRHAWRPRFPAASILQAWYMTRLLWQTAILQSALAVLSLLILAVLVLIWAWTL